MVNQFNSRAIQEVQDALRIMRRRHPCIRYVTGDGIYGPETRQAVSQFQKIAKLPVTGKVDRITWEVLMRRAAEIENKTLNSKRPNFFRDPECVIRLHDMGDHVYAVQLMQNDIKNRMPELLKTPVNGVYSQDNEKNTSIIQRKSRLPETGNVDKNTWDAMVDAYND